MKFTIAYHRINVFFGVVVAINLVNLVVSRVYWPALPAFPVLIEAHPVFSLLIEAALVAVGTAVQVLIRDRPKEHRARAISYALTLGIALAVLFGALDAAWGAFRRA